MEHRIRKLTENEVFQLMGFTTEDYEKCKAMNISKTQLYKQAGNSIVTDCIKLLLEHLYKSQYNPDYLTYDERFVQTVANITPENIPERVSGRNISYAIDANYWKGGADNMVVAYERFGKRQLVIV